MKESLPSSVFCGKDIAARMNMELVRKRTVAKQQHRANPPVEDVEAHYRVAYFFAFFDHTQNHLKTRFSKELEGALLATYHIPGNLKDLCDETVTKLKEEFRSVLPYPSGFESEVNTWKIHMSEMSGDATKQGSLLYACTLAQKNQAYYPNIHAALQLLFSLPVDSNSCEHSFSSLRRLKTWCRSTMADERLDTLAVGYINSARTPLPEKVLEAWDRSGHRRIALAFEDK